ncbi:MAG: hypothetical protein K2M09_08500 [Muribaculaceae bacterium]|nr:hypothetical protein [Muribaculaceae bacterium]MDE6263324.1 hypothetical protein [Muribaculaceae bacterium]
MIKKFLLAFTLIIANVITCNADDSTIKDIPIRKKEIPVDRPKAPSKQSVTAGVANGTLFINFAISEGESLLTITSTERTLEYTFNSAAPLMLNVGEIHDFKISISTEKGNCYESDTIESSI